MGRYVDLTGKRFGRLVVIERAGYERNAVTWRCICDCGNEITTTSYRLNSKQTTSCGCYQREQIAKMRTKHGERYNKLYAIRISMIERCNNPSCKDYPNYGGRGISVCDEWQGDVKSFCEWARNNGYHEGLSIDRIDPDGNYEPANCRWTSQKAQCNNKRNNHMLTYKGKTQNLRAWADEMGIKYYVLEARINRYHWDIERALTQQPRKH